MSATWLPLDSGANQPTREAKPKHRIETLTHDGTRVSTHNPRFGTVISNASVAPLVAEIKSVAQAQDATGVMGADGVVELLAGARRREAMRIIGKPLRVRVFDLFPGERAISIAFREGRGSVPVSFWNKSASWQCLLTDKVVPNEAKLAAAVDRTIRSSIAASRCRRHGLRCWPYSPTAKLSASRSGWCSRRCSKTRGPAAELWRSPTSSPGQPSPPRRW